MKKMCQIMSHLLGYLVASLVCASPANAKEVEFRFVETEVCQLVAQDDRHDFLILGRRGKGPDLDIHLASKDAEQRPKWMKGDLMSIQGRRGHVTMHTPDYVWFDGRQWNSNRIHPDYGTQFLGGGVLEVGRSFLRTGSGDFDFTEIPGILMTVSTEAASQFTTCLQGVERLSDRDRRPSVALPTGPEEIEAAGAAVQRLGVVGRQRIRGEKRAELSITMVGGDVGACSVDEGISQSTCDLLNHFTITPQRDRYYRFIDGEYRVWITHYSVPATYRTFNRDGTERNLDFNLRISREW